MVSWAQWRFASMWIRGQHLPLVQFYPPNSLYCRSTSYHYSLVLRHGYCRLLQAYLVRFGIFALFLLSLEGDVSSTMSPKPHPFSLQK